MELSLARQLPQVPHNQDSYSHMGSFHLRIQSKRILGRKFPHSNHQHHSHTQEYCFPDHIVHLRSVCDRRHCKLLDRFWSDRGQDSSSQRGHILARFRYRHSCFQDHTFPCSSRRYQNYIPVCCKAYRGHMHHRRGRQALAGNSLGD